VNLVQPGDRLLTAPHIAPHLSHRSHLQLAIQENAPFQLDQFDSILLQTNYPGWPDSENAVNDLNQQLQQSPQFQTTYQQGNVVLYHQDRDQKTPQPH
jgi:uncharacterized membrane protein